MVYYRTYQDTDLLFNQLYIPASKLHSHILWIKIDPVSWKYHKPTKNVYFMQTYLCSHEYFCSVFLVLLVCSASPFPVVARIKILYSQVKRLCCSLCLEELCQYGRFRVKMKKSVTTSNVQRPKLTSLILQKAV